MDSYMCDYEERAKPAPQFKASAILYVVGSLTAFFGVLITLFEMGCRSGPRPDTFIELLEWNPFSQLGAFGLAWGVFIFWLGIMVDRRGA